MRDEEGSGERFHERGVWSGEQRRRLCERRWRGVWREAAGGGKNRRACLGGGASFVRSKSLGPGGTTSCVRFYMKP